MRQRSKGDHIVNQLRKLIVQGELPTGAHLVEDALAEDFEVSRGPVRDALRQLQMEGLLRPQRRGMVVKGLARRDVDELYSLRLSLETLATRQAMVAATDQDWAEAERSVEDMRSAATMDGSDEFASADMAFHNQFYVLSRHSRLQSVWNSYKPTFTVMLGVRDEKDPDLRPTADAHAALLDVVRSGDIGSAVERLTEHLDDSRRRLIEHLNRHGRLDLAE